MRSGRASDERHHVLELVAEAEGAARLVVRRSAPRAGSSRPGRAASGSSAGRRSRRACAPGPRRGCRPSSRARASSAASAAVDVAVPLDQRARLRRGPAPGPSRNTRRRVSPGRQGDGARAARRRDRGRRRSGPDSAVAGAGPPAASSDPLRPRNDSAVAGGRAQRLAGVREGHAPRELLVVGVARQDRAGRGVALGHHVRVLAGPRRAQDPLVVGEHAQAARPRRACVGEGEQRELHRVRRRPRRRRARCRCRARRGRSAVSPAECRITQRPPSACGAAGPGVGDHASPVSSSRMKSASAVGSVTGSLAKGVRRFSRLFSAQV